eukprot:3299415-Lingulodinium_polyedra.AAC.1
MPQRDEAPSAESGEERDARRAVPIPEHEAVDFDGAARVATDVATTRIPCGRYKRVFLHSWMCELGIDTEEFYRSLREEADS